MKKIGIMKKKNLCGKIFSGPPAGAFYDKKQIINRQICMYLYMEFVC